MRKQTDVTVDLNPLCLIENGFLQYYLCMDILPFFVVKSYFFASERFTLIYPKG